MKPKAQEILWIVLELLIICPIGAGWFWLFKRMPVIEFGGTNIQVPVQSILGCILACITIFVLYNLFQRAYVFLLTDSPPHETGPMNNTTLKRTDIQNQIDYSNYQDSDWHE